MTSGAFLRTAAPQRTSLTASAGPATFEFDNPSATGHDFCLEQDGSEVGCTDVISESSATLDADVEAGEYTYYCSVAGHREADYKTCSDVLTIP